MKILVLNAGSSSLKFAVFNAALKLVLKGQVSGIGSKPVLEVDGHAGREVPHVTSPSEGLLVAAEWLADNGYDASPCARPAAPAAGKRPALEPPASRTIER